MSILVNTQNEHEEKVILAFLNSLSIQYKTDIDGEEQVFEHFIKRYNEDLSKADSEIENGKFIIQEDIELLFKKRRDSI